MTIFTMYCQSLVFTVNIEHIHMQQKHACIQKKEKDEQFAIKLHEQFLSLSLFCALSLSLSLDEKMCFLRIIVEIG